MENLLGTDELGAAIEKYYPSCGIKPIRDRGWARSLSCLRKKREERKNRRMGEVEDKHPRKERTRGCTAFFGNRLTVPIEGLERSNCYERVTQPSTPNWKANEISGRGNSCPMMLHLARPTLISLHNLCNTSSAEPQDTNFQIPFWVIPQPYRTNTQEHSRATFYHAPVQAIGKHQLLHEDILFVRIDSNQASIKASKKMLSFAGCMEETPAAVMRERSMSSRHRLNQPDIYTFADLSSGNFH